MYSMKVFRGLLVAEIVIAFMVSIVFSVKSFTGYVVSEEVSVGSNLFALAFFIFGIFGSFIYLRNFRHKANP